MRDIPLKLTEYRQSRWLSFSSSRFNEASTEVLLKSRGTDPPDGYAATLPFKEGKKWERLERYHGEKLIETLRRKR